MSRGLVLAVSVATAVAAHAQTKAPAQVAPHPGLVRVLADTPESRAEWDRRPGAHGQGRCAEGAGRARDIADGPRDQWLDQLHKGVPVVGGDVWRRLEGGVLTAAEGTIYEKIAINPVPKLTRAEVRRP